MRAPASAQTEADLRGANPPANGLWIDALDLSKVQQDWGDPHAGRSVENRPLSLHGEVYQHGVGTHADSECSSTLRGLPCGSWRSSGSMTRGRAKAPSAFTCWWTASRPRIRRSFTAAMPQAALRRSHRRQAARLAVDDADDGITNDHADWAGAVLILNPDAKGKPETFRGPKEPAPDIAGPPGPKPAIHYPRIVGATPGRPFLFLIPATGDGPLTFTAENLPAGITLDEKTGVLSGSLQSAGKTTAKITVKGPAGSSSATLTIVGGEHQLALTPPMGWNSWNVWGGQVDADKIRAAADAMVKSGLAAHGFQYVNIDDTWEGKRDADGVLHPNAKFKDMKALADYVHAKGLKLGIYSSPGPKTCAGYEGSDGHEEQDAKTYGEWGVDYLKYDWCSCKSKDLRAPYALMRGALDKSGRDIFYSLCQYGMGDVWTWGKDVGGNCWRTTGDINDSWSSMSGIGFGQDGHEKFAGPGHWNDPDMLVVGNVGWGRPHPTKLTPNEQVTHITLWSLLSAPLLIGCDMTKLDSFTRDAAEQRRGAGGGPGRAGQAGRPQGEGRDAGGVGEAAVGRHGRGGPVQPRRRPGRGDGALGRRRRAGRAAGARPVAAEGPRNLHRLFQGHGAASRGGAGQDR